MPRATTRKLTKRELIVKLEALAVKWEQGVDPDPYDHGSCFFDCNAVLSCAADDMLAILAEACRD